MLWKITYFEIDTDTKKPSWKTLYFTKEHTYFDVVDKLKSNNIYNYKIDVENKEEVGEDATTIKY